MQKTYSLLVSLLFFVVAFAQKRPNPKIGKNETEISIYSFQDSRGADAYSQGRDALGAQCVYRLTCKKYTKIGAGILAAADYSSYYKFERDVFPYAALFANVTQFMGSRQKWSMDGQVGHGIYKREYRHEDAIFSGFNKYSGGMYYSLVICYRVIVSKKIIITIAESYSIRNFQRRSVYEYYTLGYVQRDQETEFHDGLGLRMGIVF